MAFLAHARHRCRGNLGRARRRVVLTLIAGLSVLLVGTLPGASTPRAQAVNDQWELACSDNPSAANNYLFGVASHANDAVVAVGSKYVDGQYRPLIERWEQTNPEENPCFRTKSVTAPAGGNSELFGITAVPSGVSVQRRFWAVGYSGGTGRTWDPTVGDWLIEGPAQTLIEYSSDGGQTWSVVPSPNISSGPNVLKSVSARATNDAWAVGYALDSTSGYVHTLTMHWDGTTWSIVTSPNELYSLGNYLYSVSMVEWNDVWAVGFVARPTIYYYFSNVILHWNGTIWETPSSVPEPGRYENVLHSVTTVSSNQAHAVGLYLPGIGWRNTQALRWYGSIWEVEASPNPGSGDDRLYGVAPVTSQYIWAVGSTADPIERTLTERRISGVWTVVPSPNASEYANVLRSVTVVPGTSLCAGGNTWSVGYYEDSASVARTLAMRYYITPSCDLTP